MRIEICSWDTLVQYIFTLRLHSGKVNVTPPKRGVQGGRSGVKIAYFFKKILNARKSGHRQLCIFGPR